MLKNWLQDIAISQNPTLTLKEHAYQGFSETEKQFWQQKGIQVYAGKVRELLVHDAQIYIYHTDRLSAFDRFIGYVPYKGSILAEISEFWFDRAKEIMPTHLLSRPHERVLQCLSCQPFKVEVVVRGYMAGSMMRAYQNGVRDFCGQHLPEGLEAWRPLPKAMITPTTKAAAFEHDEEVSAEGLIERGVCTQAEWEEIVAHSLKLFALGQKIYGEKGWILVDTKYEFGKDPAGNIRLIDEIHTPDSSRLWIKSSYENRLANQLAPEMLDKENVRRYLLDQGFSGYGDVPQVPATELLKLVETYLFVAETLTGKTMMSQGPCKESPRLISI